MKEIEDKNFKNFEKLAKSLGRSIKKSKDLDGVYFIPSKSLQINFSSNKDWGLGIQIADNDGDDLYNGLDASKALQIIKMKEDDNTKTAKCPDCGNKYLVQTGYCLTCKKKVKESIFIGEDFRVPGTDLILEKGDSIKVIKEAVDVEKIIKDLSNAYGDTNEEQGKMVALLKGLAFSDDPKANEFMKSLDKFTTDQSKKMFN